jgi:hypothetical protein
MNVLNSNCVVTGNQHHEERNKMQLYARLAGFAVAFGFAVSAALAAPTLTHNIPLTRLPASVLCAMASLPQDSQAKVQAIDDKFASDVASAKSTVAKADLGAKIGALTQQANSDICALMTADQLAAIDSYGPALELLAWTPTGYSGLDKINTPDALAKFKAIGQDFDAKRNAINADRDRKMADVRAGEIPQINALTGEGQTDAPSTK